MNTSTGTTSTAVSPTSVNPDLPAPSAPKSRSGLSPTALLKSRIDDVICDDLHRVNSILRQQLRSPDPFVDAILEHAGRFQGKQIRPILLLLCHRVYRSASPSNVATLAASVEMIHAATLVHDDVLDDADIRRHVDTVNRRWNTETSVLLGDYLFSRAFRIAASTGDAAACELIGRATDLTCAGELQQMSARQSASRSERDYFRIVRGKTGQLFGLSCRLGVGAPCAPDAVQRQFHLAGLELGMAFQIADDVLDLTGQQSLTGKDSANDLTNQRLTLPILRALRLADEFQVAEIETAIEACGSDEGDCVAARRELLRHPAIVRGIESAEKTAQYFIQRCLHRFSQLPPSAAGDLLKLIARFAIQRKS